MCNQDIREEAKKAGLKLWELAEALGITDGNFSWKLRHELPENEKVEIRAKIALLVASRVKR
jgi:hypothetical protein